MPATHATTATLDQDFTAELQRSPSKGGWTYVVMSDSAEYFGTRVPVKVRGTIDGTRSRAHSWRSAMVPTSLPVKTDLRQVTGKQPGDTVTVHLSQRLG